MYNIVVPTECIQLTKASQFVTYLSPNNLHLYEYSQFYFFNFPMLHPIILFDFIVYTQ